MFLFGHSGITAGVIQGINTGTGRKIDLRLAVLAGLLPDLVDKPVGILYRNALGNHTRLWGHSLAFSLLVLCGLLACRRKIESLWIIWGCLLGHLVLDRLWFHDMPALLWPFGDPRVPLDTTLLQKWRTAAFMPWTIFGEALGLSILVYLVVKYRLYQAKPRKRFFKTGLLH